jgi:hypothetical protein
MICPDCGANIHPPREHQERFTTAYYCKSCNQEAIVWESVKPGNKAFQWGMYRIYCDYENNAADLQQLYMDIESDTSVIYRWATIITLGAVPSNLSADNIESKIKLYLLFS